MRPGALALLSSLLLAGPAASQIRFAEVAADWGLAFRHHHGGSGAYYQPETDGSGVVLFDYDGDGDLDVLFVDGGVFPGWHGETPRSRLFRNDGDRRFVDATDTAGLDAAPRYGMGAIAGDADGDGDLDLYLTGEGRNRYHRNRGDGSFEEATDAAGLGEERWSASATFADFDRDADLDLYVANYLDWSLDQHRVCGDSEAGLAAYCHPAQIPGVNDRYYVNRGDGTFEDRTEAAGLGHAGGKGLGVTAADFDGDGWPDLYVANDTTANFLFLNRGDGTFEDLSLLSGTAFDPRARPEAGMGIALGDLTGNGLPDIYVTNYALETNALYRNQGGGLFSDVRDLAGVAGPSIPVLGFGAAFADFDSDGDLDLAVANGHVLDKIERIRPGLAYAQPNQLFEQIGPARFSLVDAGLDTVRVSRGLAVGDLDGDGDLELVISNSNDVAEVYQNLSGGGSWLRLDLSAAGNTAAVGARVTARSGGAQRTAEVVTGSSYLSQSELTLHFGLGAADVVALDVRWPDGAEQRIEGVPAGHRVRLARPAGAPAPAQGVTGSVSGSASGS